MEAAVHHLVTHDHGRLAILFADTGPDGAVVLRLVWPPTRPGDTCWWERRTSDDPTGRSSPVHDETHVTPLFHTWLHRPVVRAVERVADLVRPIQSGDVNLCLLYVFLALYVLLAVLGAYLLAAR